MYLCNFSNVINPIMATLDRPRTAVDYTGTILVVPPFPDCTLNADEEEEDLDDHDGLFDATRNPSMYVGWQQQRQHQ